MTSPLSRISILLLLLSGSGHAQFVFEEIGASAGLGTYVSPTGWSAGAAASDYDGDGDVDLFVPTGAGSPNLLYQNNGDGTFTDIAGAVGLALTESCRVALWFDRDGDGDQDLLVLGDCYFNIYDPTATSSVCNQTVTLYEQTGPGQFVDVTAGSGLETTVLTSELTARAGVAAGDLNGDGYLDLCILNYLGVAHVLFNQGDGTFATTTDALGVTPPTTQRYHQLLMLDFDDDGWLDLYFAIDLVANQLWLNQRDGTFVEGAAAAGLANSMNDMGLAAGDYDADGDLDLYVTNITAFGKHNVLLRNDSVGGALAFVDVSEALGVDNGFWGWGTTFLDADNDGKVDLAATNGWSTFPWLADPSRFFHNQGANFSDASVAVGFDDTEFGSGLIAFDHDRDGDPDLLQSCICGPLRLLDNVAVAPGSIGNSLLVRPRMLGPNPRSIGAMVRLENGGESQMRLISAGTSFLGQEPAEALFGLGSATTADLIIVEWPDGTQTTRLDVSGPILDLIHGGPGDLDADGDVDNDDADLWIACWSGAGIPYVGDCRAADFDADGDVDCRDWGRFRAEFEESSGGAPDINPVNCVRPFVRGDVDGDDRVGLGDVILSLCYLFGGGAVICVDACDIDDDGQVLVSDPVILLSYLFLGATPPSPPWTTCGPDPTPYDKLSCDESTRACP